MTAFEFHRFRFHFRAGNSVHFPRGRTGNMVRGAFGAMLRGTAPLEDYQRIFEPGSGSGRAAAQPSPSGLADWPRPFVLRTAHLDGSVIAPGGSFFIDVHLFDLRPEALPQFRAAFAHLASQGLGPRRGAVELEAVEALDLDDRAEPVAPGAEARTVPLVLRLDPGAEAAERAVLRFLTPTELKHGGGLAGRPEFPVLFARLRDRLSTLRALYGPGPLDLDFREWGRRAADVRLRHCELTWDKVERRSRRTGLVHPLGGFTGWAEYEGELGGFLPWLDAARWVGVGRQTVWGKGDVRRLP